MTDENQKELSVADQLSKLKERALSDVVDAKERTDRAQEATRSALKQMTSACRTASLAGVPRSDIAQVAGVSVSKLAEWIGPTRIRQKKKVAAPAG